MSAGMVERVAQAIYEAGWPEPPSDPGNQWKTLNKAFPDREVMLKCARAAIAAMREPNEEMLAGAKAGLFGKIPGEGMAWAADPWRAMIDAALKEGS